MAEATGTFAFILIAIVAAIVLLFIFCLCCDVCANRMLRKSSDRFNNSNQLEHAFLLVEETRTQMPPGPAPAPARARAPVPPPPHPLPGYRITLIVTHPSTPEL